MTIEQAREEVGKLYTKKRLYTMICLRAGIDFSDAAEVVQEAYFQALCNHHQFREECTFATWFQAILRNTIKKQFQSYAQRHVRELDYMADAELAEYDRHLGRECNLIRGFEVDHDLRVCFATLNTAVQRNAIRHRLRDGLIHDDHSISCGSSAAIRNMRKRALKPARKAA